MSLSKKSFHRRNCGRNKKMSTQLLTPSPYIIIKLMYIFKKKTKNKYISKIKLNHVHVCLEYEYMDSLTLGGELR